MVKSTSTYIKARRISSADLESEDVPGNAQYLLGKLLVTNFEGVRCSGKIVEVEAYRGPDDKACHAYGNRRTKRTEVMYWRSGYAYVYLCYGIHHLFNVVTGPAEKAHAVLIRAVEPIEGISKMLTRRGHQKLSPQLTAGPGVLSKAMGINYTLSGLDLTASDTPVWLEDTGTYPKKEDWIASPRIGVDYAGDHAHWPWRFRMKNNPWTSKPK